MSRPACRPGSTTKRADTSAERPVVEEDHFVNAWSRSGRTRSSPTTSPREFSTGTSARSPASKPSCSRKAASALRIGSLRPVLDLERDAETVSRRAEEAFGAPLRHPAVAEPHELGVRRAVSADQLWMGAHRVRGAQAAVERLEPGEGVRHPLERQRVRHDAAAVDSRRHRLGLDLGRRSDLREHRLLEWVRRQSVALRRPVVDATEQQHRRVLPGAVVLEAGGLRAALEVVLGRVGLREQALHGLELVRPMEMRGAGDRDLGVVEVGSGTHDGQCLERLRRAAEERDELGIAATTRRWPRPTPRRRGRDAAPRRARRAWLRPRSAPRRQPTGTRFGPIADRGR